MSLKQISVFLVNKPGTLRNMTDVLAKNNVDMRAISLVETKEFGIARIIVDDVISAVDILKEADFVTSVNNVIAAEVPDEPGGLNTLLQVFAAEEVNIEYMYSFIIGSESRSAGMIFRVADAANAEPRLKRRGLKVLSIEDMIEM